MGGSGGLSGRLEAGGGVAPRAPWIKKWYYRLSWLKAAARLHLLCWVCVSEARKAATCRLGEAQCSKIQHLQLRKQRQVRVPRFSATGVIFFILLWMSHLKSSENNSVTTPRGRLLFRKVQRVAPLRQSRRNFIQSVKMKNPHSIDFSYKLTCLEAAFR